MQTLTITTPFDRLPAPSVFVYVSDPFEVDPSDEMSGDLNSKFEIDFNVLDLDYANLYFVS
jgi:hypothetical protein